MSKLIITTAITGSRRKEYLEKREERAKANGKKIKIYNVGQLMLDHSKDIGVNFTAENVLNAPPSVINAVRSAVFERIAGELPKVMKTNDAVFINIHAFLYWKYQYLRAWINIYFSHLTPVLF